jgi:hypothetical protein
MTYEDFCSAEDVATYKRVKRLTMRLGRVGRECAADIVHGDIGANEVVRTRKGLYRLSVAGNSDNTTERFAHAQMGARAVVMGDEEAMTEWFALHGLDGPAAYARFRAAVRAEL